MATATETTERTESKLEELRRLEAESRGDWVKCICTEVDEDDLVFRFETIHGRTTTKNFGVPDTLVGSDVMAFFDDVGRHPENASLMEGDEFWMHMEDRRVAASVPSEWQRKMPSWESFIPPITRKVFSDFFTFVGVVALAPLAGLCWIIWEASEEGDGNIFPATVMTAVGTMMWLMMIFMLLLVATAG